MAKYAVIDEGVHEIFTDIYDSLQEANWGAMRAWDRLSLAEKVDRCIYVLELSDEDYEEISSDDYEGDGWYREAGEEIEGAYSSQVVEEARGFAESLTVDELMDSLSSISHGAYNFIIYVAPLDKDYNLYIKAYDEYDGYEDFMKEVADELDLEYTDDVYEKYEDEIDRWFITYRLYDIQKTLLDGLEYSDYGYEV